MTRGNLGGYFIHSLNQSLNRNEEPLEALEFIGSLFSSLLLFDSLTSSLSPFPAYLHHSVFFYLFIVMTYFNYVLLSGYIYRFALISRRSIVRELLSDSLSPTRFLISDSSKPSRVKPYRYEGVRVNPHTIFLSGTTMIRVVSVQRVRNEPNLPNLHAIFDSP